MNKDQLKNSFNYIYEYVETNLEQWKSFKHDFQTDKYKTLKTHLKIIYPEIKFRIPKRPICTKEDREKGQARCPNCNRLITYDESQTDFNYCPTCGQAIDWS